MRYRAKRAHTQRLWSMCYTDRGIFQQPRVGVTQTDIAKLLEAGSYTASDAVKLAVVPKDPQLPMGKENAVLVTREQRRTLLSKLAAGGVEAYMNEMVGGSYTDGMPEGVISGTEAASDVSQDEGVADTADTSEDSVSETDMDANVCCNFVEAANGVTDAADTTSDLVSEEAGYMDTGFMKACNMLRLGACGVLAACLACGWRACGPLASTQGNQEFASAGKTTKRLSLRRWERV